MFYCYYKDGESHSTDIIIAASGPRRYCVRLSCAECPSTIDRVDSLSRWDTIVHAIIAIVTWNISVVSINQGCDHHLEYVWCGVVIRLLHPSLKQQHLNHSSKFMVLWSVISIAKSVILRSTGATFFHGVSMTLCAIPTPRRTRSVLTIPCIGLRPVSIQSYNIVLRRRVLFNPKSDLNPCVAAMWALSPTFNGLHCTPTGFELHPNVHLLTLPTSQVPDRRISNQPLSYTTWMSTTIFAWGLGLPP